MNCNHCTHELPALLSGDLEPALADELRAHLAQCDACAEAWRQTRRVAEALDADGPEPPVPANLEASLLATLSRRPARRPAAWWQIAAAAALFLSGLLAGLAVTRAPEPPTASAPQTDYRSRLLATIEVIRLRQPPASEEESQLGALAESLLGDPSVSPQLARLAGALGEVRRARADGDFRRAVDLGRLALEQDGDSPLAGVLRLELAELMMTALGRPDAAYELYDRVATDPVMKPVADLAAFGRARSLLAAERWWAALSELDAVVRQFPRSPVTPSAAELAADLCYGQLRDYDAAMARYHRLLRSAPAWGLAPEARDHAEQRLAILRAGAPSNYAPIEIKRRFDAAEGREAVAIAQEMFLHAADNPLAKSVAERLARMLTEPRTMSADDWLSRSELPAEAAMKAWRLEYAAEQCSGPVAWFLELQLADLLSRYPAMHHQAGQFYQKVQKEANVAELYQAAARGQSRLASVALTHP